MLLNSIMKLLKPPFNKLWIFTFGLLIIVLSAVFRAQFCVVFYIVVDPFLADNCFG